MHTEGTNNDGNTDRTINLLISSNVHCVHTWRKWKSK